jgi:WD40 repeat protein
MFGFLRKPLRILASRNWLVPTACAVSLPLVSCALWPRESVRSDLIQLQRELGYRLVSVRTFDDKIYTISFADRAIRPSRPFVNQGSVETGTVSPDGARIAFSHCLAPGFTHPKPNIQDCPGGFVLATVGADGNDLRDYRGLVNQGSPMCWSHDMSKLVTSLQDRRQPNSMSFEDLLVILDVRTAQVEVIDRGPNAFAISQCWSPGDKQIVYTVNKPMGIRTVRLYDTQSKISKDLASGGFPTWSPDGKWIAYLFCPPSQRGCAYDRIRTSTGKQELFFKADTDETGLSWSPDSRFVAYASAAGLFERTPSEMLREMLRLRVRRLDDGAEYVCADFYDGELMWFDWVS